jgi:phosphohistidine phosphatase
MKTLYLARHAKSSWKHPELSDIERPLNKRGKRDAPNIGDLLREKSVKPDLIISSPAVRARKTAMVIAELIDYSKGKILIDDSIYESSSTELINTIKGFDDKYKSVMMFGHNPGFTMVNNYLSDSFIDNIPTCGVVGIHFKSSWKNINADSGKTFFFIYPKLFIR